MIRALTVFFLTFITFAVRGQSAFVSSTLNVLLNDVRSIKVNEEDAEINLSFKTPSDYVNGVSTSRLNNLEIISTGNYQVSVSASSPDLVSGAGKIPVNTITVNPQINERNASTDGLLLRQVPLSNSSQQIIKSPEAGTLRTFFNIEYRAKGGAEYIGKPAGVYTTTITYQIDPA